MGFFDSLKNFLPYTGNGIAKSTKEYRVAEVPVDRIVSNPFQPRTQISEESLEDLADSIDEYGVITPIIVCPLREGKYQLVAGERRVRASQQIGRKKIPAVVRHYTDEELIEVSFLENLQREPMSPVDKAKMYRRLRNEFKNLSVEELSDLIGKPAEEITRRDWMLELPLITRRALDNGVLDEVWAKLLTKIDEENHRDIIFYVTRNSPTPQEILDKIREYEPELDMSESELLETLDYDQLSDDLRSIIRSFDGAVESLSGNGTNRDNTNGNRDSKHTNQSNGKNGTNGHSDRYSRKGANGTAHPSETALNPPNNEA